MRGSEHPGDPEREWEREIDRAVAPFVAQLAEMSAECERLHAGWAADRELVARLEAENARLRSGKWTPEEVQALCHNLHGTVDAQAFAAGCAEEQRRLYGCAPDADEVARLRERLAVAPGQARAVTALLKVAEIAHVLIQERDGFDSEWTEAKRTRVEVAWIDYLAARKAAGL